MNSSHLSEPNWSKYYQIMASRPPRNTLLKALESFSESSFPSYTAVDMGCGEGRDTVELLKRNWRVLAIDSHVHSFVYLLQHPELSYPENLTIQLSAFQKAMWGRVDLVNASFCLPFCPPEDFSNLWLRIVDSLPTGGRFTGQFFGDQDTWATIPGRSHHTLEQVKALFTPFDLDFWQEEEEDSTALTGAKHWHIFHVVGRKR